MPKFSVKKPFTVFVAAIIVAVFGFVAVYKMTPDLFPEIDTPYAMVMTTYPGATAEEAEKQITDPMEEQLATLNNIKNVTSYSYDNYSMVALEFTDDVNMDAASVDIRDKIDQIKGNLPESAGTPLVVLFELYGLVAVELLIVLVRKRLQVLLLRNVVVRILEPKPVNPCILILEVVRLTVEQFKLPVARIGFVMLERLENLRILVIVILVCRIALAHRNRNAAGALYREHA